jgi:FlaG/FlaF family flagellin (archaellin)
VKLFNREPVAVLAVVGVVLKVAVEAILAAADAVEVSGDTWTLNGLMAVIAAVVAVIQRRRVTPVPPGGEA